jgi:hypothetical protein
MMTVTIGGGSDKGISKYLLFLFSNEERVEQVLIMTAFCETS